MDALALKGGIGLSDKDLVAVIVALANIGGGSVLLGIEGCGKRTGL